MNESVLISAPLGEVITSERWGLRYVVFSNMPFPFPHIPDSGKYKLVSKFKRKKTLPKHERKKDFGDYSLVLKNVESKARVFHKTGIIEFDKNLWDSLTPYQRIFILLHEHAHRYYATEWKCDVYALEYMLSMGFPESVVFDAHLQTRPSKGYIYNMVTKHFNRTKKKWKNQ